MLLLIECDLSTQQAENLAKVEEANVKTCNEWEAHQQDGMAGKRRRSFEASAARM